MKRIFLVLIMVLLSASVTYSATCFSLTVADTAVGVSSVCSGTNRLFAVLETAQIRFWYDGKSPTTTSGVPLEIGQNINITGTNNVVNFKAIRTGGTSGVLQGCCD